ncbi:hypothetical protein E2562_016154 [Oryza meyeriana var. granulata]|uniref:Uncharacterized protein n=1 Tax=Oryza meyeriana var. granulata TaxID=110450 RepID=A0A6G1F8P4_9ORYZ|nr:hypothetical protein E2562_016154 [Oryza meyeriana var. granulata]
MDTELLPSFLPPRRLGCSSTAAIAQPFLDPSHSVYSPGFPPSASPATRHLLPPFAGKVSLPRTVG